MSIFEYEKSKDSYISEKLKSRSSVDAFKAAYNALNEFCIQNNSGKTIEQTIEELSHAGGRLEGNLWFLLQKFVNYLENKGLTPVSVRSSVKRIKPYLSYRLEIRIHSEDVRSNINFKHALKNKLHGVSLPEIKTLMDYASPKRRALYFTLLSSGMRIQEACHLRKRDIDTQQERWMINLRASYTKKKSERITYISKEASTYLEPIIKKLNDDDLVFAVSPNSWRATLTEEAYFGRIRRRAGLTKKYDGSRVSQITLHSFRSFFVSKCEKINEGLGHALAGHERYMNQYERYSEKDLLEFYLKAEPELTVYEPSGQEQKISEDKIKSLEEITRQLSERLQKQESMTAEIIKINLKIKETMSRESDPSNPHFPDGGPFDTRLVNLEVREINENSMVIFDSEFEDRTRVVLRKDKVYCTEDKSSTCKHVLFALANLEFYELVKKNNIMVRI